MKQFVSEDGWYFVNNGKVSFIAEFMFLEEKSPWIVTGGSPYQTLQKYMEIFPTTTVLGPIEFPKGFKQSER